MTTAPLHSKPHYPILDGLRGIAAIMVVAFHILKRTLLVI
jgi:peptidoglycan/LPS O-acetylase OafA/YrhL